MYTGKSTLGVHQSISESVIHKSTVLMSTSNNKSEITNETYDKVYIRSINNKAATSQPYVGSLIEFMLTNEIHG
jgi:hypothetical protein